MIELGEYQKDLNDAEHQAAVDQLEQIGFEGVQNSEDFVKLSTSLARIARLAARYRYDNRKLPE